MKKINKRILMLLFAIGAMFIMATSAYAASKPAKPGKPVTISAPKKNLAMVYFRKPARMNGSHYYNVRLYTPYKNTRVYNKTIKQTRTHSGFPAIVITPPSNKYCYKVRVRGHNQHGWGPFSDVGYIIPQPVDFSIVNKNTLKWKKIVGADRGYRVYVSRSVNSGYKSYGITRSPQFNLNQLGYGKYYIRVQTLMTSTRGGKSSTYTQGITRYRS